MVIWHCTILENLFILLPIFYNMVEVIQIKIQKQTGTLALINLYLVSNVLRICYITRYSEKTFNFLDKLVNDIIYVTCKQIEIIYNTKSSHKSCKNLAI